MITLNMIFKSESLFYYFFTPRKPFSARKRTNSLYTTFNSFSNRQTVNFKISVVICLSRKSNKSNFFP